MLDFSSQILRSLDLLHYYLNKVNRRLDNIVSCEKPNKFSSHDLAHHLLVKSEILRAMGDNTQAFETIKKALPYDPYYFPTINLYNSLLDERQRISVQVKALGLIISCDKYYERAEHLYRNLSKYNLPFEIKIIVGANAKKPADNSPHLIRVKAGDNYEDLASKVSETFVEIATKYQKGISIFKIDDDISVNSLDIFSKSCKQLIDSNADYAGFPLGIIPKHDRIFHWNKCTSNYLNRAIYSNRWHGPWADGPFYYLSFHALSKFVLSRLRFPSEIYGEIYEDKFVGDVLRQENINLTELNKEAFSISY